jgi:hypothetical protein
MSFEYLENTFYGYEEYYNHIMTILLNPKMKYVSLTGTPGIGKSIFYLYFFQRFKKQFPSSCIVTASFAKQRELEKCLVFEPGSIEGVKHKDIPDIEGSIHLYDGPPKVKPSDNKMVCFTSPYYSWLDGMIKAVNHVPLYLPVWTLPELCEANELLNLGLDYDTIKERILLFGGSARYCLALQNGFYNRGVQGIVRKAESIESFNAAQECLKKKVDLEDVSHQIFYYVPLYYDSLPQDFDLVFCSVSIARIVEKYIQDKSEEKRKKLVDWLKGSTKCSTLLGWLFEGYANQILGKGGYFKLRSLNSDEIIVEHIVQYRPAPSDTYESIDGYCASKLFQITRNFNHPVNAKGIKKHCDLITFTNPQELKLIFVVPKGMGDDYKKQNILIEELYHGDLSNVSVIPGIGPSATKKLFSESINTIKDLMNAPNSAGIQKFKRQLDIFMNSVNSVNWKVYETIPQYVLELEGDFK